jgi:hypothetical protein
MFDKNDGLAPVVRHGWSRERHPACAVGVSPSEVLPGVHRRFVATSWLHRPEHVAQDLARDDPVGATGVQTTRHPARSTPTLREHLGIRPIHTEHLAGPHLDATQGRYLAVDRFLSNHAGAVLADRCGDRRIEDRALRCRERRLLKRMIVGSCSRAAHRRGYRRVGPAGGSGRACLLSATNFADQRRACDRNQNWEANAHYRIIGSPGILSPLRPAAINCAWLTSPLSLNGRSTFKVLPPMVTVPSTT